MEDEKFIRTVQGKLSLKEERINNATVLPYEHIIQNLCDHLIEEKDFIDKKDKIELKNLYKIAKKPFATFQNLYLEADVDKAANELITIKNLYSCNLICDVTQKSKGQNLQCLRDISKLTNISICFGLSLDYTYNNIKQYLNDIKYEFHYGFEDQIPSFIGEVFISDQFPSEKEDEIFKMIIELINQYDIPIFIKLNSSQKKYNTNTIIPYLKSKEIFKRNKWIFSISIGDKDNYEEDYIIIKELVQLGYSVIISLYDCDLSVTNKKPIDQYYSKEKAVFFNRLFIELRNNIRQLMISNNVNFKIQLKDYGGYGYDNLFMNYYEDITRGLTKEEIDCLIYSNLIRLLTWWVKPKDSIKKVPQIKCESCGIEKDEDDKEIFRKYDKPFCTFACLKIYLNKKK